MDRRAFWESDNDHEVLAEYLAEHSYESRLEGDSMVITVGDADRLPPVPDDDPLCRICETPVRLCGDAGWRHLFGLKARGGCTAAWPLTT